MATATGVQSTPKYSEVVLRLTHDEAETLRSIVGAGIVGGIENGILHPRRAHTDAIWRALMDLPGIQVQVHSDFMTGAITIA